MGIITYTKQNFPVYIEIGKDFPKCRCGETFKVYDCFDNRKEFHGTTAECKNCGEYFCGGDYNDLKKVIPLGQEARLKAGI